MTYEEQLVDDLKELQQAIAQIVIEARKVVPTSDKCALKKALEDYDRVTDNIDYRRFHRKVRNQ